MRVSLNCLLRKIPIDEISSNALSQFNNNLKYKYSSSILFAIRSISFYFNINKRNASYGDELQNLVYSKSLAHKIGMSRTDKRIYFVWNILMPFCWSRYKDNIPFVNKFWILDFNEEIYSGLQLLNFLWFLKDEKYRNWFERIFGIYPIVNDESMERMVVLEFTDRQMTWHVLSEFLASVAPIFSSLKIEAVFRKLLKKSDEEEVLPTHSHCGICRNEMLIRQVCRPCRHVFCYYCIESVKAESYKLHCPSCSQLVSVTEREK
ncbi:hypothetical protein ROZALSC1DRAFT_22015 [Rozella allomycis CSF55]|uniref:RING-type E3 ubiquitin transferase (cysteine targeting) n=1 Tax=Rozella allomycis (strain CSF55) TaxID=988480 RepID=A0A4P9YJY3_ROZAC|nr:hypothetical protein ROZALSC1DRAFT_22015 [Rozella allomycis CSF55]